MLNQRFVAQSVVALGALGLTSVIGLAPQGHTFALAAVAQTRTAALSTDVVTSTVPLTVGVATLTPASADLFVNINRGGTRGTALASLLATYRSHPQTANEIDALLTQLGPTGNTALATVVNSFSDEVGLAAWVPESSMIVKAPSPIMMGMPAPYMGVSTAPTVSAPAQVSAVIIAHLNPLLGANPLLGVASFKPLSVYQGTQIYTTTLLAGTKFGYSAVVNGYGVIGTDITSTEKVIDAQAGRLPALANDADYNVSLLGQPALRAATGYVSKTFVNNIYSAEVASAASPAIRQIYTAEFSAVPHQAMAYGVTAMPTGLEFTTSVVTATVGHEPTAVSSRITRIVGSGTIAYGAVNGIVTILRATGLVPATTLTTIKAQTGIDIQRDVYSLFSGDVAFELNDEPNVALGSAFGAQRKSNGHPIKLAGAFELVTEVASPSAARRSIDRLLGAALANVGGGRVSTAKFIKKIRLADGSSGYVLRSSPTIGYSFQTVGGHFFLVFSTNLTNDVHSPSTTLAADSAYQAALAQVGGSQNISGIEYFSVAHLENLIVKLLVYGSNLSHSDATLTSYTTQVAPLLAPMGSFIYVNRILAPGVYTGQGFLTIQ